MSTYFYRCIDFALRIYHFLKCVYASIRHGDDPFVGFDGAEWIVCRFGASFGHSVE